MTGYPDGAEQIRALISSMIDRRPPVDDREAVSIVRFLGDLDRLVEPCSESADITHVTASVFVVSARGLILHKHKRLGIWIQPGGHIDPGECAADAALRECFEETGLAAHHFSGVPMLVHVDAHDAPRGHYHLDLRFLLAASPIDPSPPVGESPDVEWVPFPDLADRCEAGLRGAMIALQDFSLRPSVASDAPAVAEVYLRSFKHAYANGNVRLAHSEVDVRRWVREEMLSTNSVSVAVSCGIVIGFVATTSGWLNHLYVDPAFIGRGVGSALFDDAVGRLPGGFSLWTFQENSPARGFYERRGLVAAAFTDGDNDEGQPDVRYERRG